MLPDEVSVGAPRDRVRESPEEIAARISVFVDAMQARVPMEWGIARGPSWQGTAVELAELVRARPSTAARGVPDPEDGYVVTMFARHGEATLSSGVSAGDRFVGRRNAVIYTRGRILAPRGGHVDVGLADALFESIVTAWNPLMARLSGRPINDALKSSTGGIRGGWKIPVGYRLWLRDGTVEVDRVAEGVERRVFAGGTLLSVPVEWPAQQVVSAMLETLQLNGLDEMPHPVP